MPATRAMCGLTMKITTRPQRPMLKQTRVNGLAGSIPFKAGSIAAHFTTEYALQNAKLDGSVKISSLSTEAALAGAQAEVRWGRTAVDESAVEKEVYSFNPAKMPSNREVATATFRAGVIATIYGSIAGALTGFWFETSLGTAFGGNLVNLALDALFIMFALWVRRNGTFWSVGILLILATFFALWQINFLTSYSLSKLQLLLYVVPQIVILVGQAWLLRAFIYLSANHGALTATPAIQVD